MNAEINTNTRSVFNSADDTMTNSRLSDSELWADMNFEDSIDYNLELDI